MAMEVPFIPLLDLATESVEVDSVGPQGLETYLPIPGFSPGDFAHINWRSRMASGEPLDIVDRVRIFETDDEGRALYIISQADMQALDGGDVFFSYHVDTADGSAGEESLRLHFHVSRPMGGALPLGVAQVMECHDRIIDIEEVEGAGALVVTPPYQSMALGDVLELSWTGYFDDDFSLGPVTQEITLMDEAQLGRPLQWTLDYSDIALYVDGYADLEYSITYANGETTASPRQRFHIKQGEPSGLPRLAPPLIPGETSDAVNPVAYPNGIKIEIPAYPSLRTGDQVVLYITGSLPVVHALRTDLSTVDSGYMALLDTQWITNQANVGKRFDLSYQFSHAGAAMHSMPLSVTLRSPLSLPWPTIQDAVPEGGDEDNQATVQPSQLTGGAQVRIPDTAELGGGKVKVHWEGHPGSGNVVVDEPMAGQERVFLVPREAVPANIGKRLDVRYSVTLAGEQPEFSEAFDLKIADYNANRFSPIQGTQVSDNKLSLRLLNYNNAHFTLSQWPFMAQGDWLEIKVVGLGNKVEFMREAKAGSAITEQEFRNGKVDAYLSYPFVSQLPLYQPFSVQVRISFDQGVSFKVYNPVEITLVN
ncbi:hypothetical protein ACLEJW_15340 [Pseudomonas sp. SMSB3]|uniref:hypothetical protein n=1 Tax=unclassified Pseudomonas TaxID=196821 RepID=UPI0028AB0674|nr:hypothetical protein [Pseudomonas sp.]